MRRILKYYVVSIVIGVNEKCFTQADLTELRSCSKGCATYPWNKSCLATFRIKKSAGKHAKLVTRIMPLHPQYVISQPAQELTSWEFAWARAVKILNCTTAWAKFTAITWKAKTLVNAKFKTTRCKTHSVESTMSGAPKLAQNKARKTII